MSTAALVVKELKSLASAKQAANLQRFFKTGAGDYAEGDIFLGVMVPKNRKIAKKYAELSLSEIKKLTDSDYHEVRFCGLLILVSQFEKAKTRALQKKYFDFFLIFFLIYPKKPMFFPPEKSKSCFPPPGGG